MTPTYDIINYSTSTCPFEPGQCGKEGKKLQKFEYLRTERAFKIKWKNLGLVGARPLCGRHTPSFSPTLWRLKSNSLGLHLKNPDLYSVFQTVIRSRLSEDYVNFIVFFGGFLDAPPPAHWLTPQFLIKEKYWGGTDLGRVWCVCDL